MPFYQRVQGSSGSIADVDASGQILVTTSQDPTKAGAVRLYDSGGSEITVEENGALSVSQDELILSEQVDGNSLNTNKWLASVSGMTVAQSGGYISLNSGAATTTNSYAILSSIMNIPLYGDMPVEYVLSAKVNTTPIANATIEIGLGSASGVSAPTDGAFFRWNPNGSFQAAINNGGSETTQTITPVPAANTKHLYSVVVSEDHVEFSIDDVTVADIANPVGIAFPLSAGHQPVFARTFNGASVPGTAPVLSIGQVLVRQIAVNLDRPWRDVMAAMGMGGYQSPVSAFGQTANHANSTSPVSATLSNTTAGYSTLGGRYQFASPVGAATDYAIFAYQIPSPFKFYVTGVFISSIVTGAAIVTATILDWSLGINASAVSLATSDSAGVWGPRRIPLGMQGFAALAGIGSAASDLSRRFDPPLVVDSSRYLHVVAQIPNGAATASLVLRGDVLVTGYFE